MKHIDYIMGHQGDPNHSKTGYVLAKIDGIKVKLIVRPESVNETEFSAKLVGILASDTGETILSGVGHPGRETLDNIPLSAFLLLEE